MRLFEKQTNKQKGESILKDVSNRKIKNSSRISKVIQHRNLNTNGKISIQLSDSELNIPVGFIFSIKKSMYIATEFGILDFNTGNMLGFNSNISRQYLDLIGFNSEIKLGEKIVTKNIEMPYQDIPQGTCFRIVSRKYKDVIFIKSNSVSVSINKLFVDPKRSTNTIDQNKIKNYTCYI